MSLKTYSLAIDEVKQEEHNEKIESHFEPQLRVLVNGRYVGSDSKGSMEPVKIRGRITVSF